MNKIRTQLTVYRLPILSGILIGTSYIPFPPWALLFCLTPLFVFWMRETSLKRIAVGGWLTQLILNLIGFHWIAYTATEFGHFPLVFGILVLIGFAATAHLHYPLAGFLARWLERRFGLGRGADLLLLVSIFGLCDHFMPMIFPWHLGYPWLWAGLPGAQLADVIGFEGLYFLTLVINALFAYAVIERSKNVRRSFSVAALAIGLFAAPNILSLGRAARWRQTDAEISVLAVQGNIGNFEKLQSELGGNFGLPVVRKYLDLSREGLASHPQAQLVLWPETAFPTMLDRFTSAGSLYSMTRTFVQGTRRPLLLGGYSRDLQSPAVYNGLFLFDREGEQPPESPYRKSILLVFGETFPFSDYFPYVEKLFPNQGSFGRGGGPKIYSIQYGSTDSVKVGPQICYEGLYPWHSSELSRLGAEIFVNVTNDSWFWWPFEPHQHLFMTLARALEFRRPLLRSTNTGITTAMLADGTQLTQSPNGVEWTGLFRIPYLKSPPATVYAKYGYLWTWFLAFLVLASVALGRRPRGEKWR